jgi:DNA-binding HxlR family transcriptional regulator
VKINALDMKKKLEDYELHVNCPIRNVLDRFGDKWSILVIQLLGEHKTAMRFNEVAQTIGDISQKMLTVTLRTLEADGMVVRKHYPEIPPRVEYELTDLGKSLLPHINGLAQWAVKNYDAITRSRKKFAARKQLVS